MTALDSPHSNNRFYAYGLENSPPFSAAHVAALTQVLASATLILTKSSNSRQPASPGLVEPNRQFFRKPLRFAAGREPL